MSSFRVALSPPSTPQPVPLSPLDPCPVGFSADSCEVSSRFMSCLLLCKNEWGHRGVGGPAASPTSEELICLQQG